uniref:Uncharacterized protein n=1 Tax=Clytia hemisphaerica TaxID=252671 RepID=A0A7M5X4J4_9CNID
MLPGFESNLITAYVQTLQHSSSLYPSQHTRRSHHNSQHFLTLLPRGYHLASLSNTNPSNIYRLASLSHTQIQATFIALPHFSTQIQATFVALPHFSTQIQATFNSREANKCYFDKNLAL